LDLTQGGFIDMGYKLTSIKVDSKLHTEAKKLGIPLGKTLEDALKEKLNKDWLIEDLKGQYTEKKREARELKAKIDRLEKRKKEEIEQLGEESERMSKALEQIMGIHDRIGEVTDEQLRFVANQKHVSYIELTEEYAKEVGVK